MSVTNYIPYNPPVTTTINLAGYMFDKLSQVYISGGNITYPAVSAIDLFSTNPVVSSICPPFSGYLYPSANYTVNNKNQLSLTLTDLEGTGFMDIILFNQAGYTKLSDKGYLIKITENNQVKGLILAENGAFLATENFFNITLE